jgi:phenylpyruvate tautomerase PptA (4-oxalocrotonate tautomerase family)
MPFLRFDIIEGRSEQELATLLDVAHQSMLDAFHVPLRDRYQIVHEHKKRRVRIEDTGLGFERTDKVVLIQVTTRPRTTEEKTDFYRRLCADLGAKCGVPPTDVMVSFVENTDEDWSFGNGEAQFLTGKLGVPQLEGAVK